MWRNSYLDVTLKSGDVVSVEYLAKVYDSGSEFGINGGRISKLCLKLMNGRTILCYDRGWDVQPTCEAAELALAILLERWKEA